MELTPSGEAIKGERIMENQKVTVENRLNASVVFSVPELRYKRVFDGKGAKKMIDLEILKEGIGLTGIEYLFKNDILHIDNKEVRIELGLEEADEVEEEQTLVDLTDKQIKRYLTVAPTRELKELLPKLTNGQKQMLIDYAIENEITALDKCELLKEATHKDVFKAIQLKRQAKEE